MCLVFTGKIYCVFAALFTLIVLPPCVSWTFAFLFLHTFAKAASVVTVKTLYTAGWASLASLLLVITASLISGWLPRRSLRACITFNALVLYFTETINFRWRCRGVHGPKLCLGSFFSARYVSCFRERKVVALRDIFLTHTFVGLYQIRGYSVGIRSFGLLILPL